jgi:hypothetical protein
MRVRELEGELRAVKSHAAAAESRLEAHNAAAAAAVAAAAASAGRVRGERGGDRAPHDGRGAAAAVHVAQAPAAPRGGIKDKAGKASVAPAAKTARAAPASAAASREGEEREQAHKRARAWDRPADSEEVEEEDDALGDGTMFSEEAANAVETRSPKL